MQITGGRDRQTRLAANRKIAVQYRDHAVAVLYCKTPARQKIPLDIREDQGIAPLQFHSNTQYLLIVIHPGRFQLRLAEDELLAHTWPYVAG